MPEHQKRHLRSKVSYEKEICFVCDEKNSSDVFPYNEGGLGRCPERRSEARLLEKKESYLKEKYHQFYQAGCNFES